MWKPIYHPGPWKAFQDRRDVKGLPLMEARKKYLEEQILFENYVSSLQTLNTLSPSVGAAGGPLPTPVVPPSDGFFDTLKIQVSLGVFEDWTFGYADSDWGWVNPANNRLLFWAKDSNTPGDRWFIKQLGGKVTCTLPIYAIGTLGECPPVGVPESGWDLGGGSGCYGPPFTISPGDGALPLNYSTSLVAQFNLVSGDATADEIPDGQIFTIDSDPGMCLNLPQFSNDNFTLNTGVYRFAVSAPGAYIGLEWDDTEWAIVLADPATKGTKILATGGDASGFAGKLFTSTAAAATPFTATIDYP